MAELLLKGQPIGRVKGVLFDKDGTLSRSEPHLLQLADDRIAQALQIWRTQGRSALSEDALRQQLRDAFGRRDNGLDPAGTLAVAARRDNLTSMATVLCLQGCSWPEASRIASDSFDASDQSPSGLPTISELLPGVDGLIEALDQAAVTMAVISNDTRDGIDQFLSHHDLHKRISGLWSADDAPSKPDPGAVQALCAQCDLQPEDCALIGDAETDLTMATAAGIGVVLGFRGGWAVPPHLPSADHLFERWADLNVRASA
ncbi:MAG: HAD-IA family hydrolase [Cyanobacteriota bacterium]|nr:HAD-IA family hydrolase [Cyanobacteriota bacterium]